MTKTERVLAVGVLIAIVIAIGAYSHPKAAKKVAGTIATGLVTNFSVVAGELGIQIGTNTNNVTMQPTIGTCSTASSTIIAIANPFSATSTLYHFEIYGTMGATTSDIVVATSTTQYGGPYASATSSLAENIMGLSAITANAQFFSVAGVPIGPGTGYKNPAGAAAYTSNRSVVVGPSEYVLAVSTSTGITGGAGADVTGLRAIPSSCTYKALWYSN